MLDLFLHYFASDEGLRILAAGVGILTVIGLFASVFLVIPAAWIGLRATENRTNGKRVYARHLWRQALMGTTILSLYFGVATVLLTVEDYHVRSALSRLGVFLAVFILLVRNLDLPYTQWRMAKTRERLTEDAAKELIKRAETTAGVLLKHAETTATELREESAGDTATVRRTVRDTNETAHRMEEALEQNNVISSEKQDVAAGKQDVAAAHQQTDLDLGVTTQAGVNQLVEQKQQKEGDVEDPKDANEEPRERKSE